MRKRLKQIAILLTTMVVMLNSSGCWDSRELNAIGIVMGVGIDKAKTPGEIEMTVQVADVSGGKSSSTSTSTSKTDNSKKPFFFDTQETGPDVLTILHKLTYTVSRKLYFSHNQLIIFGEDIAKEGVRDSLDFFLRSYEPRMTVYIFVAKGEAGDVLNTEPNFEKMPATEISTLMQDPIGSIDKTIVFAKDFLVGLISETTSAVAPIIEVTEEDGKKLFQISGFAVFKGDKLVGELGAKEGRGYKWVTSKVIYSGLNVMVNEKLIEVIITSSKGQFTPVLKDDGSILIKVKITAEGTLDSQKGSVNFSKLANAAFLEEETNRTIKQEIENTINKTREMGTDIFGFGESISRKYPRIWKTLKPQWDKIYKNIEVEIDVKAKIRGVGRISKSLYPEKE